MRNSATVMLYWGLATFTVGLMLQLFWLLPYMLALFVLNFLIGLFIKLDYAPSIALAKFFPKKSSQAIGAIQKKFAWYLGLLLSSITFTLSLYVQTNDELFVTVCALCIFCNTVLYFEAIFSVCVGCQLYSLAQKLKLIKPPKRRPRCMGNRCD